LRIISFTTLSILLRHKPVEDPVFGGDDFFKTGHGLRLVKASLRLGEETL
jgi:hypothetical protein